MCFRYTHVPRATSRRELPGTKPVKTRRRSGIISLTLIPGERRQVQVRPCVRADLVAFAIRVLHALYRVGVVDAFVWVADVNGRRALCMS